MTPSPEQHSAHDEPTALPIEQLPRLGELISHTPVLLVLSRVEPDEPVEFATENIQCLGYTVSEFTTGKRTWGSIIHPHDLPRLRADTAAHLACGLTEFSREYRVLTRGRQTRWLEDRTCVVRDAEGKATHLQRTIQDITERKHLARTAQLHDHILENMAEGVVLVRTSDGLVVYANPNYAQMFGYARGELLARHIAALHAGEEGKPNPAEEIIECLRQADTWRGEVRAVRKDGSAFWTWANITTFDDPEHGEVWLGVQRDITAHKVAQEQLRDANHRLNEMAHTDALTNLPNRRGLLQILVRELDRVARYGGHAAVAMADVDHLKQVNDAHGHQRGDEIIIGIADVLRNTARTSDVVARYGGDEFVVLMPHTSGEQARIALERIREAVFHHSVDHTGAELGVTVSAGISLIDPAFAGDATDILNHADEALYAAKLAGRNCIRTLQSSAA